MIIINLSQVCANQVHGPWPAPPIAQTVLPDNTKTSADKQTVSFVLKDTRVTPEAVFYMTVSVSMYIW